MEYKPGIRIWPGKSNFARFDEEPSKKLVYIPKGNKSKKKYNNNNIIKFTTIINNISTKNLIIEIIY